MRVVVIQYRVNAKPAMKSSDFMKNIRKEGDKNKFAVFFPKQQHPRVHHSPNRLIRLQLGICKEGSPTKKVAAKCCVEKCISKAVLVHKDKGGDHQVFCDHHGKGIDGTYPATGVL